MGTAPMGLWDPLGFATDCSAGKLLFYREAELKHGRVGMIATLGLIVGEKFHPFFGGNIDVPGALTIYEVPLRAFWSLMMIGILVHEFPSAMTFEGMDMNEWGVGGVSTSPELSPVAQDNGGKSGNEAFFGGKASFTRCDATVCQEILTSTHSASNPRILPNSRSCRRRKSTTAASPCSLPLASSRRNLPPERRSSKQGPAVF